MKIGQTIIDKLQGIAWDTIDTTGWRDITHESMSQGFYESISASVSLLLTNVTTGVVTPSPVIVPDPSILKGMFLSMNGIGYTQIFQSVETWLNGATGGLTISNDPTGPKIVYSGFASIALGYDAQITAGSDFTQIWSLFGDIVEKCVAEGFPTGGQIGSTQFIPAIVVVW